MVPRGSESRHGKRLFSKRKKKVGGDFFIYLKYSFSCTGMGIFSCGLWDLVPQPGMDPGPLRWSAEP